MKPGKTGIERIWDAFKYSVDGFKATFKTEAAFRQEMFLCLVGIPIILLLRITMVDKLLLFSGLFFIVFAELVNTAVEVIIDRISDKIHPLSKKAKDIGSLMVLLAILYAATVWGLILFKNFF